MKHFAKTWVAMLMLPLILIGAAVNASALEPVVSQPISAAEIEGLSDDFITGADVSSLLSLEASGRVFYGFDGKQQDLLKTLSESGVNYIRVRVWNDPFDEDGNGYGGGNCTLDTAVTLGRRAAAYGMALLVDFHYSDFWADPGKQQAPKAWQAMTPEEKKTAIYDYTAQSLLTLKQSGVKVGMVQVGNETTNGFCGETEKARRYSLMRTAAEAVRDTDPAILIAVHFTNPEKKLYAEYARDLQTYGVDYDVFATSFYPEFHGTIYNLKEQLETVHTLTGKKVMIAETSWAYDSTLLGAYKRSVQGQADEIADCVRAMTELGDYAIGVFYWEPAWIDVPGDTEQERIVKRETCGAGWASSYSVAYDPDDAGKYYGATACIPSSLFDPDGRPLESLKVFRYVRQGSPETPRNYLTDPSFEAGGSAWKLTEASEGTVDFPFDPSDAREGNRSLHFWSDKPVEFTAEQTLTGLPDGEYTFSLSAQGGSAGDQAMMKIYAVSGSKRYEQRFTLDGWRSWKVPMLADIPCSDGKITVGVAVTAAPGAWGSIDSAELIKASQVILRGDADGDGAVTVLDATAIQRRLVGFTTDRFVAAAADVTGNGLDILDATAIQRYLAGFENTCDIGETFLQ